MLKLLDIKGQSKQPFFFQLKNVVQLKRKNTTFSGVKRSLKWLENRSTGVWGQQFFARKHV